VLSTAPLSPTPSKIAGGFGGRYALNKVSRSNVHHVYEGSRVVRQAVLHSMLKDSVRRTCEHLATSEERSLAWVRCVKGEYATRISEILYVEQQLTSNPLCKTWTRTQI